MKWIQGKVVGQTEWAPGLFSLFIETDSIEFVAGQFAQLCLDEEKKHFRPYSLLNAPGENVVEIYYSIVNKGLLTPQLASLSLNDKIWLSQKASGRFTLNEVPKGSILWCFATGTGLGPFISILKTQLPWERFEKIILAHSVRYRNELTHQSLIETWQESYPQQFHWCPIVTREKYLHAFNARIPLLLQSLELEQSLQLNITPDHSQVMLCGNPEMVMQVTQDLTHRGLKVNHSKESGQITTENYWKLTKK